jgi:uncharacterized protein YvpB
MKRLLRIFILVIACALMPTSPARGGSLPESAYVTGVIGYAQSYSLSCESRSAVDLAAYWGVNIGETAFLQALPRADNPDQGFVGDPSDAWGRIPPQGYGVHASPVAQTLRAFGLQADSHRELGWDDLREEINAGRPVIVWVIGQMWGGTPLQYEASDGSTTTVAAYEHTMILTGYSPDTVQLLDAYTGMYQYYRLGTFLNSWAVLGNMAVFAMLEETTDASADESGMHEASYTVQNGDYLVALAERFGTTWQELANLNSIGYPFTIFPGQVLQIPGGEVQEAEAPPEMENPAITPVPNIKVVNFEAHLPMIQQNHSAQNASPTAMAQAVMEPGEAASICDKSTLFSFCECLGLDWRMLMRLNSLHSSHFVRPGQ